MTDWLGVSSASRLGAAMLLEDSWFQAIIVHGKKDNVLRHETPLVLCHNDDRKIFGLKSLDH